MQIRSSTGNQHQLSFFSRYIFSITPRCKRCGEKVSVSPSAFSRRLWILTSVIIVLYLIFLRPPHFSFIQYVVLWSLLSLGVRRYMIFATESERTSVNSEMVLAVITGRADTSELTKNISISMYYMLFMILSYTIVTYVFMVPSAYSWVAYAVVFSITPIGYYEPEDERCSVGQK